MSKLHRTPLEVRVVTVQDTDELREPIDRKACVGGVPGFGPKRPDHRDDLAVIQMVCAATDLGLVILVVAEAVHRAARQEGVILYIRGELDWVCGWRTVVP